VGALALATLGLGAAVLLTSPARVVTWAALRDAEGHAAKIRSIPERPFTGLWIFRPPSAVDKAIDESRNALAERFGSLFDAGYLDHAYLVDRVPREGFTQEAQPVGLLILAYLTALRETFKEDLVHAGPPYNEAAIEEILRWMRPVLRSARAKESLVSLLITDYEWNQAQKEPGSLLKLGLVAVLQFRDHDDRKGRVERLANVILSRLGAGEWSAVLDHCRHAAERVRAGSLLLLCHHPERDVFLGMARAALKDPSSLVRIGAAGTLAYHGDSSGAASLREGLAHERWEVRWWCAKSLAHLGGTENRDAIAARLEVEPDNWVKRQLWEWRSFMHRRGRTDSQ
jgi:hypothetical protein